MRLISLAKFAENRDLREKLLATGTKEIAEATGNEYWGVGAYLGDKRIQEHSWTGQNWLGRILQDTRSILRGEMSYNEEELDSLYIDVESTDSSSDSGDDEVNPSHVTEHADEDSQASQASSSTLQENNASKSKENESHKGHIHKGNKNK